MRDKKDYIEGRAEGEKDLIEGWVEKGLPFDLVESQLKISIGASDNFIKGYYEAIK